MSPKKQEYFLPSLRVTEKLREETITCSDLADEKLSEYIKKAIEERNKKVFKRGNANV